MTDPCPQCGGPVEADGRCLACLFRIALSESPTIPGAAGGVGFFRYAPTGPPPEAGATFGPYTLIRLLGRGGFGVVWEAEHRESARRVALKIVTEVRAGSPDALERFEREGQLAAAINDPHCVFIYGVDVIEGYPVIAMELMARGTLQDELDRRGRLPAPEAVDRILDLIIGLEAAQQAGVIHRDVKPSNCFLDDSGTVKIGDFGISTTLEAQDLTRTGSFVGTPVFAAPEQARGRDVDFRTDIYALGATLYTLLTGHPPFAGGSPVEVLARLLSEQPARMDADLAVPNGLERLVRRMLAKQPRFRYRSYASLRAALLPFSSTSLTRATLAQRFCAYAIDDLAIGLTIDAAAIWLVARGWPEGPPALVEPLLTPQFYYFLVAEWYWGRSLGKRLFGLRVMTASGSSITFGQAFVRTSLFWFVPAIVDAGRHAVSPPAWPLLAHFALTFVGDALLFITIRRVNGFAGLHDLLSGTRVMATADAVRVTVPDVTPSIRASDAGAAGLFGPYRALGILWATPRDSLLLAYDDVLRRHIWIHTFADDGAAPPRSAVAVGRRTRLLWLNGSREPGRSWDAYEAPSGTSLAAWTAAGIRLWWREARAILRDVAAELAALAADGRDETVSIERVWVDASGHARLLDFPAPGAPTDATAPYQSRGEWRLFVQRLTDHMLGTRPLPEYARALVARTRCGQLASASELVEGLRQLADRPAIVTPVRRVGSVLAATAGAVMGMAVVSWAGATIQGRQALETLSANEPIPYRLTGTTIAACMIPMIVLAFVLVDTACLRLFGIALQTADGRPAGRLRSALRAAVVWLPIVPIVPLLGIKVVTSGAASGQLTFGFDTRGAGAAGEILFIASVATLALAGAYAVIKPARGVPDLVCGTHLVPK